MTQVFELLKLGNDTFLCKVVPIDSDGSCLFSSISYLLCGNVQSSFVFRQTVVDYILSNWDRFKVFTHDHQGNNYPSHEAYKTAMLNLVLTAPLLMAKNLSAGHFDAYVFSSNNEECEIFESNIKVPGKQEQINPKMPPKKKRSVRYRTHKDRENRRKRENEAPLKQESRRESNRLRMER
ncbi:hypothetical protein TNCV_3869301 [Trichonephila clavipes]|nr:hypothetical protein TNCV_3869301 [Trichonephila clavipes]